MEFQADAKSKYPSIFSVIVVIILNLSKILVIFNDKGVIYLAGVILLEPILYSCMYMYLRSKHYEPLRNLQFDTHIALKILKDSYPLIFASAFFMIYARIDQVMIKNMMSAEYVGLYDAAVRMSEISYFIPNIIVAALFPAIINAKKISEVIYFKRIKKLLITLLLVSTGIALITTLLATYFTLIIFGSKFLATVPILRIYVWSNIGTALNMLIQQVLISENLTKNVSLTIFFGMVTNVVLNVLLIPRLGMSGAALASLISYMIPFLSLYMFKKTRTLLINIANH
jgi:O-antigen/teichoic acid export membrane protein